ncbi:MAG TPA: VOC family protein [Bryobacteraceae bacterium]|nr:VOC family protein [Bryobacteraceae bacterium]
MTFSAAVPEIPAADVDKAADYYVSRLGFTLDWGHDQDGIAGVSRGNCRLFITNRSFRESYGNIGPILFWLNLHSRAEVGRTLRGLEGHASDARFGARG